MTKLEKSIAEVLGYYDLFDRPLSALEIFKCLPPLAGVSFFAARKTLAESSELKKFLEQKNGLYFFADRGALLPRRTKRMKNAQLKWRRLKKYLFFLAFVPWLRLAAASGSLTANNTKSDSDLDLFLIVAKNRLWTARIFAIALTQFLGVRRHGQLIKDRLCFNYYLTKANLNIKKEASRHWWHSAQEYARLTPVIENEPTIYDEFIKQNHWLKNFLNIFPWPNRQTAHRARPKRFAGQARQLLEYLLNNKTGDWLEKKLGQWQSKRIFKKSCLASPEEFYLNDHCLMFHPQSKSDKLTREFNLKMKKYYATNAN